MQDFFFDRCRIECNRNLVAYAASNVPPLGGIITLLYLTFKFCNWRSLLKIFVEEYETSRKQLQTVHLFQMFVTAVCVLVPVKLRWPGMKNFYDMSSFLLTFFCHMLSIFATQGSRPRNNDRFEDGVFCKFLSPVTA